MDKLKSDLTEQLKSKEKALETSMSKVSQQTQMIKERDSQLAQAREEKQILRADIDRKVKTLEEEKSRAEELAN